MTVNAPIPLRWSAMSAFMSCQRKYDLGYRELLVKNAGSDSRGRMLGSHVHAGIHAALNYFFDIDRSGVAAWSKEEMTTRAVQAVRAYNNETVERGRKVYDYASGTEIVDEMYYALMNDIVIQAVQIVRFQIPLIGLGTQYRVASVGDVFTSPISLEYAVPMTEWNFHYDVLRGVDGEGYSISKYHGDPHAAFDLTGTADAVLQDLQTGEYILFDWKCRQKMPDHKLVDLDGQLRYYAAVINHIAGRQVISRTCQYQMNQSVPRPAVLTQKKGVPSVAAIISTWEVWSKSLLDAGIDPEPYREVMEPKLRVDDDFRSPIFSPVTPISSARILNIVLNIGQKIEQSESSDSFPPMPSIYGCEFCDFKPICRADLNGGDPFYVRQTEYHPVEAVEGDD